MPLHIHLLGEFRVLDGDRDLPPTAWEHRRSADMVKLVALAPGHRLVKDVVLEALWPQLDATAAAAALHKAASLARKVLGADRVVLKQGEVWLGDDVSTDVGIFEAEAKQALASGDAKACLRAAARYAGELLPGDRYAEWASAPRERLAARHLELLRRAGAWEQLVEHDPLDERAQLALMRTYADAGNRASALRQFRRMKQVFASELGVSPSREAVRLYDELSRGSAVHASVASPRTFVGREVELARARALLRKVAEGRGHTLLVRGDPGLGKTTLCERVLVEAAQGGATTLRGAARRDGSAYAPVVEAIDQLLIARPELAAALPEGARKVLARLATAITFEPGDEARAIGRQQVLSSVGQLVTIAANERPVVLVVDDLHEADDSTLELVHYLAQAARTQRVMLLATARADVGAAFDRTRAALIGQRALSELELGPVARGDVAAIVAGVTGAPPSAAALDVIHARAAGNPLFAEILASAVAPDHDLPAELSAVLDDVLARAGDDALTLLRRIAVLGIQFTAPELLQLADAPEETAYARLDQALRARVFEEAPGGYRFHHALYVDALVRGLPAHRRREAHRAAAHALAATGAAAARIAHQLVAAEAKAEAVPWLVQAARDEAQVGAYASALRFVERALENGAPEAELLAMRAGLLFATGAPETIGAYARALEIAPASMQPMLRAHKGRAHLAQGDVPGAAATLAGSALPDDPATRVTHLIVLGQIAWFSGDLDAGEAATEAARRLAEDTGDHVGLVEAVLARGIVAHSKGAFAEHIAADLLAVERAPALTGTIHEGHLCVSSAYLECGLPYGQIEAFARELRTAGERAGARRAVAFADLVLGETSLLAGTLVDARAPLERAAAMSLEVGATAAASFARLRLAQLDAADGDGERARALLDDALALARGSEQGQRHLLQRIYGTKILQAPDAESAIAIADESELAIVGPGESCMGCSIALLLPSAMACARAGQVERAARTLAMAEQIAAFLWPHGPWQAALDEARAAVAAARGDGAAADALLATAAARYAACGQAAEAARCGRGVTSPRDAAS